MSVGRSIETTLRMQGFSLIAGIDEVGRGAWAGPVVAAAVVLPENINLDGVRDSKILSASSRRILDRAVRSQALAVGIGWVSAAEVDRFGLSRGISLSGWRALLSAGVAVEAVILDGKIAYLKRELPTQAAIKADATELSVAAASVVAKVARDRYMTVLHRLDPSYGFAAHKGYGTAAHLEALRQLGISGYHRRSYKPIHELIYKTKGTI